MYSALVSVASVCDLLKCDGSTTSVKDTCYFFHYKCDGVDDVAWGCGYRTLQTLCSSIKSSRSLHSQVPTEVPTIQDIQQTLVRVGDKCPSFIGSKEWIGTFEASIVIDEWYNVPCRLVHHPAGQPVSREVLQTLNQHFQKHGSPVMIGGDVDGASKTLVGLAFRADSPEESLFLIADPHYCGPDTVDDILKDEGIKWFTMNEIFNTSSFYNFCLPLT